MALPAVRRRMPGVNGMILLLICCRCIQWNALKDQVYDFQMLTANQAANSTKAAPQVAIRFRCSLHWFANTYI